MSPDLVEKYRAAKELIEALRSSSAAEVRRSWSELFEESPPSSRQVNKGQLIEQIRDELQRRLRAHVYGTTRVRVLRPKLQARAHGRV